MAKDTPYQTIQSEDGTTWVEIATAPNDDASQLMQGFLEAEGIDAQIEPVESHVLPTSIGKLGEVRIYVPVDDEKRAIELLQQRDREFEKLRDDDSTLVTDDGEADVDENAVPERE